MIDRTLVFDRLSFIKDALRELDDLAALPPEEFVQDKRTVAAAESFLRRSLEALFDVGRHILAKSGHADLAKEYKSIARGLGRLGVIPEGFISTLEKMAGFRNRLVYFYHEVSADELNVIIRSQREDLRLVARAVKDYVENR